MHAFFSSEVKGRDLQEWLQLVKNCTSVFTSLCRLDCRLHFIEVLCYLLGAIFKQSCFPTI